RVDLTNPADVQAELFVTRREEQAVVPARLELKALFLRKRRRGQEIASPLGKRPALRGGRGAARALRGEAVLSGRRIAQGPERDGPRSRGTARSRGSGSERARRPGRHRVWRRLRGAPAGASGGDPERRDQWANCGGAAPDHLAPDRLTGWTHRSLPRRGDPTAEATPGL